MTQKMGLRPREESQGLPSDDKPDENNTSPRNKNIAVTLLALDPDKPDDQSNWYKDEEMPEQKIIHEFQARRKYSKIRKPTRDMSRDKTVIELGLSGTSCKFGGTRGGSVESGEINRSGQVSREDLRNGSKDEKVLTSRLSLPPISPRQVKSENTSPFPSHFNSLLNSDFGFKRQISDSFTGFYNPGRTLVPAALEKELELHAKRHIYACHNLGSVRKGSRAAQSVFGLKQTMTNGTGNNATSQDLDSAGKSRTFHRKRPSVFCNKTYPSLTTLMLKPTIDPKDGLPQIYGSSLSIGDFNSSVGNLE